MTTHYNKKWVGGEDLKQLLIKPHRRSTIRVLGAAPSLTVCSDTNGFEYLHCHCTEYTRNRWCSHLLDAYMNGLDAGSLSERHFYVHLKKDLILPMRAMLSASNHALQGVFLLREVKPANGKNAVFVGFIDPAKQGRFAARELAAEYIAGLPSFYNKPMVCRSEYHDPHITPDIRDLYTYWAHNKCFTCCKLEDEQRTVPF